MASNLSPLLALAGLVLLSWTATPALAQPDDPRVNEARGHFEQAEAHYAAGQYALAAQGYQRAHDLLRAAGHPRASMVLFNVGRSLQELGGRDADARSAYAAFLEQTPVTAESQDTIRLAETQMRELDARLAQSPATATSPSPSTSGGGGISPVGPILLAAGGASVIAGVILAGVAFARDQDHLAACPDRMGCDESLRAEVDTTRTLAIAGDVLWIAGAAIAATGLVLTFVLVEGGSSEQVALQLRGEPGGGLAALRVAIE